MNCNFIWWSLPQKIKENLNIDLRYNWSRIPIEINLVLDEQKISNTECYNTFYPKGHNITWWNLPLNISKVCELIKCSEEINFDITAGWEVSASVYDKNSFISYLESNGLTNITITNFSLVDNRLTCYLSANGTSITFDFVSISEFNKIGNIIGLQELILSGSNLSNFDPIVPLPESLKKLELNSNTIPLTFNPSIVLPSNLETLTVEYCQMEEFDPSLPLPNSILNLNLQGNFFTEFNPSVPLPSSLSELLLGANTITDFNPSITLPSSLATLNLAYNQIVSFNPSIALPESLVVLELSNNQMTTAGYIASEPWANSQPSFLNECNIFFNANLDSVAGTDLENILLTKNVNILP